MDLATVFVTAQNSNHRQYEALRAYFVERLPAAEVGRRFGYSTGSVHQLVYQFRQNPQRRFFADPRVPGVKADDTVRQVTTTGRRRKTTGGSAYSGRSG